MTGNNQIEPSGTPGTNRQGFTLGGDAWYDRPAANEGVIARRIVAYLIDIAVLLGISLLGWFVTALSFFVLTPLMLTLLPILPIAYHTFMISSTRHQATIGQNAMGLRAVNTTGPEVTVLQAFVTTVLFYLTLSLTSGILLLWCLFDDRDRCLHDIVSGIRIVRNPGN